MNLTEELLGSISEANMGMYTRNYEIAHGLIESLLKITKSSSVLTGMMIQGVGKGAKKDMNKINDKLAECQSIMEDLNMEVHQSGEI